jgi:hypothetical protein
MPVYDQRRSIMTIRSSPASTAALVGAVAALIAGALVLWLSVAPAGHAASADQFQETTVTVQGKAISWDDNAACANYRGDWFAPSQPAGFGTSPPAGGTVESSPFLACVLSNATWNVDAVATPLTTSDASASIPADHLRLYAGAIEEPNFSPFADPSPAPIAAECHVLSSGCNLGAIQRIVAGAQPSPQTSGFYYSYKLDVPGSAPSGTYNGLVTFTASN